MNTVYLGYSMPEERNRIKSWDRNKSKKLAMVGGTWNK